MENLGDHQMWAFHFHVKPDSSLGTSNKLSTAMRTQESDVPAVNKQLSVEGGDHAFSSQESLHVLLQKYPVLDMKSQSGNKAFFMGSKQFPSGKTILRPEHSSNLTPGHISGEKHNPKRYIYSIHCSTICNSQDTRMFIDREIDIEAVLHVYNGILSSRKKEYNSDTHHNITEPQRQSAQ